MNAAVALATAEAFYLPANPLIDALRKILAPPPGRTADFQNVLEAGCGTAKLSTVLALHHRNWNFTVFDLDAAALPVASRVAATVGALIGERLNLSFGRLDVLNLAQLRNREFDACFSEGMLNLFLPEVQAQAMKEMLRVADVVAAVMPNGRVPPVAEKYLDPANKAVWGHSQDPEILLPALREAVNNLQTSWEVVYPYTGDKDRDRQFILVARWNTPREVVR